MNEIKKQRNENPELMSHAYTIESNFANRSSASSIEEFVEKCCPFCRQQTLRSQQTWPVRFKQGIIDIY
jgi:hypothetical protein